MARVDLAVELLEQVNRSITQGAQLYLGGILAKDSTHFPATILENVQPGMTAFDEELFGPVFSITKFSHDDDAIALANGRTLEIADNVRVIRPTPQGPKLIEASFADAKGGGPSNILLGPGDIVSVEETPSTFVVGILKDFMRIGLTAGIPGL